jgi:DNA modification methylase
MSVGAPAPGSARFVVGDSRLELRQLRERVTCTITSPPYFNIRNYGDENQIGYGQTEEDFLRDIRVVFEEVRRVSTPDAFLWIVADEIRQKGRLIALPHQFAIAAGAAGWNFQSSLVWQKDKTYPWLGDGRIRKIHETVLLFSRAKEPRLFIDHVRDTAEVTEWWFRYPERYHPLGRAPTDVWFDPIPTQGSWGKGFLKHECPFPPSLIERMVELTTGPRDVVLDPFAGTGVVAATASVMGRSGVAMDIVPKFEQHFVSDVLPSVQKWWLGRQAQQSLRRSRGDAFFRANLGLRATKFARLVAEGLARHGIVSRGVWVSAKIHRTPPWVRGKVILLLERPAPERFESLVEELTGVAPLSKFGIALKVSAAARQKFRGRTKAYLSSTGMPGVSTRPVTKTEFAALARDSSIRLTASDLPVRIDDILAVDTKGWRGREVEFSFGNETDAILAPAF